ncbi:uncharacterized protein LOC111620129 isoform X2 [Centruroides sculpturatus]|uniref:uncharacterized protein LOC111620129 isoform X2 n=1 Tax=Centruroides sculpturatus TaxID=218467 RepID=UPI000C6DC565|nr:uncharacterized protein LOC111620129 isoform X2 [Centruroides sculpturatus]
MDDWRKTMKDFLFEVSSLVNIEETSLSKWIYNEGKDLDVGDCVRDLVILIRILLEKFPSKKSDEDTEGKKDENRSADNELHKQLEEYEDHYFKLNELIYKLKNQSVNQTELLKRCVVELGSKHDEFLQNVTQKYQNMEREKQQTELKLAKMEKLYASTLERLSSVADNLKEFHDKLFDKNEIAMEKTDFTKQSQEPPPVINSEN